MTIHINFYTVEECNYNTFLHIMNEIKSLYINECNYKQKMKTNEMEKG